MGNSQNARYAHYPEKSDYFLDPNQTLTKEKIQEAFAKSNLLKNQNKSDFNKENINNINIPPSKKNKKENTKMDLETIEGQKSIDLIASTSTNYSSTNNSKISIESNNNQITYGTNLIFHPVKNSDNKINISPQKIFDYTFKSNTDYISYTGEYLDEIYSNLLSDEKELKLCPKMGYMTLQGDINEQMRAILIDWLVEVHYRFRLKSETLFQTVWIIDTYLSMVQITRAKLQLLGIASLLISCKSNEIYYPQLNEFTDITDGAYVKSELIEMEKKVLKILKFNIISPTSNDFYNIISKAFGFDQKQFYLGKYFLESSLIDYRMIKYNPSVIGVSCAYIVMKFFGINNYKILYKNEVVNDPCPQKIIKEAARDICALVKNLAESTLKAVKDKYCLNQFLNVALLCEQN
jgi:cyclin B